MDKYSDEMHVNVGTGEDVEIRELVYIIKDVIGYHGKIINDLSKPDGTPRKLLDVSLIHKSGWKHQVNLEEGIRRVYNWYLSQENI